jgi:hypothetical protein
MFFYITITIAIISVLLALSSLKKQSNLKEIKKVKKELAKKRVIYQRESSV